MVENGTFEIHPTNNTNLISSDLDEELYLQIKLANSVFMVIAAISSVLGIGGNALILMCLIKEPKIRTTSNYLVAHLAFVNLIYSALIISSQASLYHQYTDFACVAMAVFGIAIFMMSLHSQLVISFNRYMLVAKPVGIYNRWFTLKKVVFLLTCVWCFDIIVFSLGQGIFVEWEFIYIPVQSMCLFRASDDHFLTLFAPITWLSFILALVFYVALIIHIRKNSVRIGLGSRKDIRASMTLFVVMVIYLVTYNILPAVMTYVAKQPSFPYLARYWINGTVKMLQFANVCISPIIFGKNIKDFKTTGRKLLCSCMNRSVNAVNTEHSTTVPNTGVYYINNRSS